jgi:M6 family metalloprotease-like protein
LNLLSTRHPRTGHRVRPRGRRLLLAAMALLTLLGSAVLGGSGAPPASAVETGGSRPLLVVLLNRVGGPGIANTNAYYEQLFFGSAGTTAMPEYYSTNSRGRFTFRRAGLLRVQDRNDAALGTVGSDDLLGLVHGLSLASEAGFNFASFDANRDGTVTNQELAVEVVDNYSEDAGATRWGCATPRYASVRYCGMRAAAGHRSSFDNFAHELSHTLNPVSQDLYYNTCRSQDLTLMSCTAGQADQRYKQILLDPWHRIQYGWISELVHQTNAWPLGTRSNVTLAPACRASQVASIIRPSTGERFIIENRKRCTGDWSVKSEGVVVWYQKDDAGNGDPLYSQFDTNVALQSIGCVFSAAHAQNRDNPVAVTGGRHRLWWADGSDTGADLTVGSRDVSGNIPISITRTNNAPGGC